MPFDITTRTMLEHYTAHPPATDDAWYGPWTTILTTLFPSTQGYIVNPHRLYDDSAGHIPDFIVEVLKLSINPITFRTVLTLKVINSHYWEFGIYSLRRKLDRQTRAAFAGTAHTKLYWIAAVGPHWRYGEKENCCRELRPLIRWHHTNHDEASFEDFQGLVRLVAAL